MAARTKRERRKANEIKTRTIQRMQLQMTAPLDIGLEQTDATLGLGQDDMFDLGRADGPKTTNNATFTMDDDGDAVLESSDEDSADGADDDEPLDSEDERENKLTGLEAELDGLYDAYQGRLRERDAKFKVKEARRKNAEREEWSGIQAQKSDGDDSDEEGGWDVVQDAKVNDHGNSSGDSSDESDAEEAEALPVKTGKRTRVDREFASQNTKRPRLTPKAGTPGSHTSTTAAAKVWFAQDVFSKVDGLDHISDSESLNVDEVSNDEASSANADDQVLLLQVINEPLLMSYDSRILRMRTNLKSSHKNKMTGWTSGMLMMKIKMKRLSPTSEVQILVFECYFCLTCIYRIRSTNARGCDARAAARQSPNEQNPAYQQWLQPVLTQFKRRIALLVSRR